MAVVVERPMFEFKNDACKAVWVLFFLIFNIFVVMFNFDKFPLHSISMIQFLYATCAINRASGGGNAFLRLHLAYAPLFVRQRLLGIRSTLPMFQKICVVHVVLGSVYLQT